ncbi:unnamed protein product, partial [Sphacelaria rigidula]
CHLRPRKTLLILNPKVPIAQRLQLDTEAGDWTVVPCVRFPHTQATSPSLVFAFERDADSQITQMYSNKMFSALGGDFRAADATPAKYQIRSPRFCVYAGSYQVPWTGSLPVSGTERSPVLQVSYTRPSE